MTLTWDDYVTKAAEFRRYPQPGWLYPAFGLLEELAELGLAISAWQRNVGTIGAARKEMGDVCWNLAMLQVETGQVVTWPKPRFQDGANLPGSLKWRAHFCGAIAKGLRDSQAFLVGFSQRDLGLNMLTQEIVEHGNYDGLWYLDMLPAIWQANLDKLAARAARNVIHGQGDDR